MDFREFSEAYNNYLMHAGTNNGVNIGRLTELLKKYKKQSPPEKHPKIDQLSRIVIQQAQNGNLEQAREAAQDFNRIIPGSPSSMLFQAIINELTKPQPTYRMADSVPRPITGKRLSHSNDFREFSEEYNDYLMHAGSRPIVPTSIPGQDDRSVIEETLHYYKPRGYTRLTINDIYKKLSSSEIKEFARTIRSTGLLSSGEPYIKMAYERTFGVGSRDKSIIRKQNLQYHQPA